MRAKLIAVLVWLVAGAGVLAGLAGAPAEAGGKRVALVVGNSAYRDVTPLDNPGHDAELLAQTLRATGFTLVGGGARLDLTKPKFDAAVAEFGAAIEGADVALFYYSGHGMQVGGVNYLVPIDANPKRVQDLDFQMVSAEVVIRQFTGGGTRLNLMILDACRNNPFGGKGLRSASGGLAEMRAPKGTLISYATQPGAVAADGEGRDSPFSTALAASIAMPGMDLFRLFNRVGLEVEKATGGEQQPWFASSPLDGEFYFTGANPAPGTAAAATEAQAPAPAAAPLRSDAGSPAKSPQKSTASPAAAVQKPEAVKTAKPAAMATATAGHSGTGNVCARLLQYISGGADKPSWASAGDWRRCGGG